MPVTLPPITRRRFVKHSLAFGSMVFATPRALANAKDESIVLDPDRVALLADTHIATDPDRLKWHTRWRGSGVEEGEHEGVNMANSLTEAVRGVLELNPRPAHLIVNGDCAHTDGKEAEYREFIRLIEPVREAGITVHVTIGNHDNRENLWKVLPFLKREEMGIQVGVIELAYANLILLDTGTTGFLGDEQLDWLATELDERADKAALVFAHYNPYPNRGVRGNKGMLDGASLLKVLQKRKHARAYLCGHTHEWQFDRRDHLHLINQPAVSYSFAKEIPNGWIDMKLSQSTAELHLQCIESAHKRNGEGRSISLEYEKS